jgi:hypothetical protein
VQRCGTIFRSAHLRTRSAGRSNRQVNKSTASVASLTRRVLLSPSVQHHVEDAHRCEVEESWSFLHCPSTFRLGDLIEECCKGAGDRQRTVAAFMGANKGATKGREDSAGDGWTQSQTRLSHAGARRRRWRTCRRGGKLILNRYPRGSLHHHIYPVLISHTRAIEREWDDGRVGVCMKSAAASGSIESHLKVFRRCSQVESLWGVKIVFQ